MDIVIHKRPPLEEFHLKALFYGEPGVGKTVLAASAQKSKSLGPVLFGNADKGTLSLAGMDLDITEINDLQSLARVLRFLRDGKHSYKTFVLDSITEMYQMAIESIVQQKVKNAKSGGRSLDDVYQEDYGEMTSALRRAGKVLRELPMHVIITAHSQSWQDENSVERVVPAMTPRLRQHIVGFMDVVGYLYTSNIEEENEKGEKVKRIQRKLLAQPVGKYMAKDRTPGGKLGTVVEDPTMSKIWRLIAATKQEK